QRQPRDLSGTIDAIASSADEIASKVSRWEYVYDAYGRVAYERYLDRNRKPLGSIIYAPSALPRKGSSEPGLPSRIAYNTTPNGSLAREKGSCSAFEKYDYSQEGYKTQTHYLDQDGGPTPGKQGAFIRQVEYDRQGHALKSISLWKDGRPMND